MENTQTIYRCRCGRSFGVERSYILHLEVSRHDQLEIVVTSTVVPVLAAPAPARVASPVDYLDDIRHSLVCLFLALTQSLTDFARTLLGLAAATVILAVLLGLGFGIGRAANTCASVGPSLVASAGS